MVGLSALDKLHPTQTMIDHALVGTRDPPFCGVIIFPARNDDPAPTVIPKAFCNLVSPALFILRQMDVAPEFRNRDLDAKLVAQELGISVHKMHRR